MTNPAHSRAAVIAMLGLSLAMTAANAKPFPRALPITQEVNGEEGKIEDKPRPDTLGTQAGATTTDISARRRHYQRHRYRHAHQATVSAPLGCLPPSIREALARAHASCGVHVISTLRRGAAIRGTGGSPSMHRYCRAADFTTPNPSCVLSTLRDWPGKLSTDYSRMQHFHIDDGSYARFVHGGGGRKHKHRHRRG